MTHNKEKKIVVLCDSAYDFKYEEIFKRIPYLEIVQDGFFGLMARMLKDEVCYHIRYIKFRGYFFTLIRIFLIILFSKVKGSKIIWSCHNVYEHSFPNKIYNDLVRWLLAISSSHVIVFHEDVLEFLPSVAKSKATVSNFGDYKGYIEQKHRVNKQFEIGYSDWLKKNCIDAPDIVSISSARLNNLKVLKTLSVANIHNILIVAPGVDLQVFAGQDNVFPFNQSSVRSGISEILSSSNKIIGYIGHNNISVPTSVYMYASYGVPMLAINCPPVNSMFANYMLGVLVDVDDSVQAILDSVNKIRRNYLEYSNGCFEFISKNSWNKAALDHEKVFGPVAR